MKALLIADTHWLWYAVGRWARGKGHDRPRVDYMRLRDIAARFLIQRWGAVYDLDCQAFVVNRNQSGMNRFTDLLRGFGFTVTECGDPTQAIVDLIREGEWDLVLLAVGSAEAIAAAAAYRAEGRKVVTAAFEHTGNGVDAQLKLDRGVLYG